jgi:hypothetical protein
VKNQKDDFFINKTFGTSLSYFVLSAIAGIFSLFLLLFFQLTKEEKPPNSVGM